MRLRLILVFRDVRVGVVVLIEVAQGVVDLSVLRLIGPNVEEQVSHRALAFGHVPVLDGDVWGLHFLPHRETASVDVFDFAGVGDHGFFFEVANKAVAGSWRHDVGQEEGVEKDTLGAWSDVLALRYLGEV